MNNNGRFPLHIQIVVALLLGAVFGAIFSVNPKILVIGAKHDSKFIKSQVHNWDTITFIHPGENGRQDTTVFNGSDQIQIVKFFRELKPAEKSRVQIIVDGKKTFTGLAYIKRPGTIATSIKPIGTIFINLLSFIAIPLVIASLIVGAASLEDFKKLGRIGGKTFLLYMVTTTIAITIGLACANLIKPGERIDSDTKNRLIGEFQEESSETITKELEVNVVDFFVEIVPKNPIRAMADGNMLQIVFFAVIFGVTLTFIEKKRSKAVLSFFNGVSDAMIKMVDFIMKLAPFGVFALIAATISEFGFEIIQTLIWYIAAVLIGLLIQTTFVYFSILKIFSRMSIPKFLMGMRNAQAVAFSTSSSAATLPVTFDCLENKLGISKQITGFVLPLGATINMDGTALYQGVAAVFIAQVYGFDLNIAQQITIVITAVLASIGTAPVPGVGIIMLVMILRAINVPPEGIALILGVDRILDMARTVTNITGDASVAIAVASGEQKRTGKPVKTS